MRPLLHPSLVNGRFGDPVVYVETLFETRAILFDLGDIAALSPRKIQRLEHIFVSHAHIDHFVGFDRLLRLLIGREKTISFYGPTVSSTTCATSFALTAGTSSIATFMTLSSL